MAEVIDGKSVAADVVARVKSLVADLAANGGTKPGLAVVIVGEDPASQVYVASKSRTAKECGFLSVQHTLPEETGEADLLRLIGDLNADPAIHGILVQLPLPRHIDSGKVIQAIAPEKDVDGFHFVNVGKLGTGELATAFVPCTPAGSMLLIERVRGKDLSGLNAVVLGRSNIVGKPMANLLPGRQLHRHRRPQPHEGLPAHARTADILVAAVGRPKWCGGLDTARRHRHRRRHQPRPPRAREGRGQVAPGRRRRLCRAEQVAGASPPSGRCRAMTIAI